MLLDIVGTTLICVGRFFIAVTAIGVLRLPDFFTRVHAVSKTETLGIGVVMLGLSAALVWGEFDTHTELMLKLLRVVCPYMLLVCLAAVFMGMLNSRGYFFIPAMGATLLNVVMIATVLLVAPSWGENLGEQIFALAFGVLVAGVAQAGCQVPYLFREG